MPITPTEADRRREIRARTLLDTRLEMQIDEMLTGPPAADGRWYLDDALARGDQREAVRTAYREAGWLVTCEDDAIVFARARG